MLKKLNRRSFSQQSGIEQPTELSTNPAEQPALPDGNAKNRSRRIRFSKVSGARLLSIPDMPRPKNLMSVPDMSNFSLNKNESTPKEMVPVLTFLAAHGGRPYIDGYFMILNELNNNGEPIKDRKWNEVFASLNGTIITMWDAAQLDQGVHEISFINITDCYMRSVESLGADLQNVIIMSTTMKNRYIFQFGTKKLFNEWSAALRLAIFERTSLQEAYTGALLSSKGSQMNGIQSLLLEFKHKKEFYCDVRFGVGMPWKRVWVVMTPNVAIRDKKLRKQKGNIGQIEFFSDPKSSKSKKKPLAVIHQAFAAYAVFPEKAVLADASTLLKMECLVEFDGDDVRESSVFLMPELNHSQKGYETLIATLIPIYDVFGLYGRPKRLNADKSDLNSLLFALPSLPRIYYLDVIDIFMLASLPESQTWSSYDWIMRIKELLARKIAVGFKGTGNIHQSPMHTGNSSSSGRSRRTSINSTLPAPGRAWEKRPRAVSEPRDISKPFLNDESDSGVAINQGSHYNHVRPAPSPPMPDTSPAPNSSSVEDVPTLSKSESPYTATSSARVSSSPYSADNYTSPGSVPMPAVPKTMSNPSDVVSSGPISMPMPEGYDDSFASSISGFAPSKHGRTKSESNNYTNGLLSPELSDLNFGEAQPMPSAIKDRHSGVSMESFASALDTNTPSSNEPPLPTVDSSEARTKSGSKEEQNEASQLFDPTYRPAHLSYADYSEYMRHYLQNLSAQKPAPVGISEEATDSSGAQIQLADLGNQQAALGVVAPIAPDSAEARTLRPSTPPSSNLRAQLLNTPIRTPEISVNTVAANEAKPEELGSSTTALSAPRIGAYPNAPGSPAGVKASQDKPAGPRPLMNNSNENSVNSSVPLQAPRTIGDDIPRSKSPGMPVRTNSPYMTQDPSAASRQPVGQIPSQPIMQGQMMTHGQPMIQPQSVAPPRSVASPYYAQQQQFPSQTPRYPPQPYAQPYQQQGYSQAAYMQSYPQGYMAPGYQQGSNSFGMQASPQPQRYRPQPGAFAQQPGGAYNPQMQGPGLPQGAPGPSSNGPGNGSKSSFIDSKAQQLRSVRAQAMDGKNFGI